MSKSTVTDDDDVTISNKPTEEYVDTIDSALHQEDVARMRDLPDGKHNIKAFKEVISIL